MLVDIVHSVRQNIRVICPSPLFIHDFRRCVPVASRTRWDASVTYREGTWRGSSEHKESERICGFSSVPLLLFVFADSIVEMRSTFAVLASSVLPVAFAATYGLVDNHVGADFLSTFTHEAISDPTHGRVWVFDSLVVAFRRAHA